MSVGWRSITHLQIVLDEKRPRLYATKYAAKGESTSVNLIDAMSNSMKI